MGGVWYLGSASLMTGRHITSFARRLGLKWKKMANVSMYSELWDIKATSSQPAAKSLQLCCIQSTLWTWVRWSLFFRRRNLHLYPMFTWPKPIFFFRLVQILSTRVNKGQNLSLDLIACHIYWEEVKKCRKACDWHMVSIC